MDQKALGKKLPTLTLGSSLQLELLPLSLSYQTVPLTEHIS